MTPRIMPRRVIICFLLVPLASTSFIMRRFFVDKGSPTEQLRLRMATSSSDLKKKRQRKSVVTRLARAAKEAAAKKAKQEADNPPALESDGEEDNNHLSSITNLSRVIDQELLRPSDGYRPPRETSSMRILLEHNERTRDFNDRHVAIVFSKPLWQDQITTEYASRLVSLARAMKFEYYKPHCVCFCGPTKTTKGNLVAETSAGVIFFRHLCAANQISLEATELCIIQEEKKEDSWSSSSLIPVVDELLQHRYLETWLDQSQVFENAKDEYGFMRERPRKRIYIHCTLISTDYHLCNLNDIHVRSPGQSPLNTLSHELEQEGRTHFRGIVKTTWCFRYSTYPMVYSKDELTAFLGKCYLMAQELRPLLINIRGVVNRAEFFQRDNYRALVATRRSLVTILEEMNEAFRHNEPRKTATASVSPFLKAQLQKRRISGTSNKSTFGYNSTDVALESALLSLGRCLDLVRPAGKLSSVSVPREDWKSALEQLEYFLALMQSACDPDRPLPATEWGKLSVDNLPMTNPTFPLSDAEIT